MKTTRKHPKNIKGAGRKCSICKNEHLKEIDAVIKAADKSFRVISQEFFGSISKRDAIRRHAANCLTAESGAFLPDESSAKLNEDQQHRQKTVDIIDIPAYVPFVKTRKLNLLQRIRLNKELSRTFAKYRK